MARIRIDTHRVREVGRRLRAEGDRMSEIGQELGGAIGRLDIWAWDGRSRRRAEPMLNRVRPQSARLSDDLDGLGRTLQRVADLFEQRDNTAARDLGELPWVDFTPGSGGAGLGGAAIAAAGAAAGAIGGGIGAGAGGARVTGPGDGVGPVRGGAGPGGGVPSIFDSEYGAELIGGGVGTGVGGVGLPGIGPGVGLVGGGVGLEAISGASGSLAPDWDVTDYEKYPVKVDAKALFKGRERVQWPERRGRPKKHHPSVELKRTLWDDQVWEGGGAGHTRLGGVRLGGRTEAEALKGEAGIGFGRDRKGWIAGCFAAGTLFTAGASGVIGSTDFGLAAGGDVTAGKAEAFLGYRDGQAGVKLGGTIVSAEGTVGMNVAGWNVGVTGGIGLKFELGFSIGKRTKIYLGPFTIGLNIGKALGS